MFDRFTDRARKVMSFARQEAERFNNDYVGTEHILLGFIKVSDGTGFEAVENLGVDLEKVKDEVEEILKPGGEVTVGPLPYTSQAKKVLEYAIDETRALDHNYVGTEHLMLGLLKEGRSPAFKVLSDLGLKFENVRDEILDYLDGGGTKKKAEEPKKESFKAFAKRFLAENAADANKFITKREKRLLPLVWSMALYGSPEEAAEIADSFASDIKERVKAYLLIGKVSGIAEYFRQAGEILGEPEDSLKLLMQEDDFQQQIAEITMLIMESMA